METDKLNHIISSKNESPFKSIKEDKNKDHVEIIPEDTFATGLPEWNLLPPYIVVRRKIKK